MRVASRGGWSELATRSTWEGREPGQRLDAAAAPSALASITAGDMAAEERALEAALLRRRTELRHRERAYDSPVPRDQPRGVGSTSTSAATAASASASTTASASASTAHLPSTPVASAHLEATTRRRQRRPAITGAMLFRSAPPKLPTKTVGTVTTVRLLETDDRELDHFLRALAHSRRRPPPGT